MIDVVIENEDIIADLETGDNTLGKKYYMCDPDLNTRCTKTTCIYNPNAVLWACDSTSDVKCALRDLKGIPILTVEGHLENARVVFPSDPDRITAYYRNGFPYKELKELRRR